MRTFVAVFPPQEVREALFRAAQNLPSGNGFRLVGQERIHLTLKFLGYATEDELARATQALEHLSGRHEPFEVSTSGFGAFPSERRARTLWAGIEAGADLLRALAEHVEDLLEPVGFGREDRPYVPHLTLGRAKGRQAKLDARDILTPSLGFDVSSVELVQSVPGKYGVVYEVLATFPL